MMLHGDEGSQFFASVLVTSITLLHICHILDIRTVQRPIGALAVRVASSAADSDTQQFQRRVRPEFPGKVRMGLIPDEWFTMFYKKTGVTGPYVFGVGLITYLCSKEIYVMEHEYYTGLSLAIMCIYGVKKFGPKVAAYCDKEIDRIEDEWNQDREQQLRGFVEAIENEKKEQWRAEGSLMLMEAKKENVALQLEAAFRERAMTVYREVKRRLDYQVECRHIDRRINHKHMVNWIVSNVLKSITPQQEKDTLNKCIADLNALAANAK